MEGRGRCLVSARKWVPVHKTEAEAEPSLINSVTQTQQSCVFPPPGWKGRLGGWMERRWGVSITAAPPPGTICGGKGPPPWMNRAQYLLCIQGERQILDIHRFGVIFLFQLDSKSNHAFRKLCWIIIIKKLTFLTWTVTLNQAVVILIFYLPTFLSQGANFLYVSHRDISTHGSLMR